MEVGLGRCNHLGKSRSMQLMQDSSTSSAYWIGVVTLRATDSLLRRSLLKMSHEHMLGLLDQAQSKT